MVARLVPGQITWKMTQDDDGERDYTISYRVQSSTIDGPAVILLTPGLPQPGQTWQVDNDIDIYATCGMFIDIEPVLEGEPNRDWKVTRKFSTKNRKRCVDAKVEDPLLEPVQISGAFHKERREAKFDRFGAPILTSSHEVIRGHEVEFDESRAKITISSNVATFRQAFELPAQMVDCVNDRVLWGIPRRMIKLSDASFERKYYGRCHVYYTRKLEFEVNYRTFDRNISDEGTKVIKGQWEEQDGGLIWQIIPFKDGTMPDSHNPTHFIRFQDRNGENCRVILNGRGAPAGGTTRKDDYYLAIAAGQGKPLSDSEFWVPFDPDGIAAVLEAFASLEAFDEGVPLDLAGEIDYPPASEPYLWVKKNDYKRGQIVFLFIPAHTVETVEENIVVRTVVPSETSMWIANRDVTLFWERVTPPDEAADIFTGEDQGSPWSRVTTDFTDAGLYSDTTEYTLGKYVLEAESGRAAYIHVEKYNEANFLLLGIPTVF